MSSRPITSASTENRLSPSGHEYLEITEALVLCRSRYQALLERLSGALGPDIQAELYSQASQLRFKPRELAHTPIRSVVKRFDRGGVVKAEAHSDKKLADLLNGVSFPNFVPLLKLEED